MSIIIAKGAQITQCANNTSTSNQMYSFGKDAKATKQQKSITQNYYNLPSSFKTTTKVKSGITLGYGERSNFLKIKKDLNPKTYFYKDTLFKVKSEQHATIGPPVKNIRNTIDYNNASSYYNDSGFDMNAKKHSIKITLKGRPKSVFEIKDNKIPGPGKYYNDQSMSMFNINKKSLNTSAFSNFTDQRFKNNKGNNVPGPCYNPENNTIKSKISKIMCLSKSRSAYFSPNSTERINLSTKNDSKLYY